MRQSKNTKRALLASVLSVALCCVMFVGTTLAWFTDSVTNKGNIIQSGRLDIVMEWADGTEDINNAEWKDASEGAIFDYDKWEPGYTVARHIRVTNNGTLALKYQLQLAAAGEIGRLAEVIDVYAFDNGKQITSRGDLAEGKKIGTLKEVLEGNTEEPYENHLSQGESHMVTIALKMQETADNNYQGLAVGSGLAIQIFAAQYTEESDSFGSDYDAEAKYDVVNTADDLKAAFKAGGNYKLGKDIQLTDKYTGFSVGSGVTVTLDLNGKTLESTSTVDRTYVITNRGTLTINGDGVIKGLGGIKSTAGKVIINGGAFYCSSDWEQGTNQHTLKAENSEVIINGGTFDATVGGQSNAMINVAKGAVVTINGGTFKNVSGELSEFDPYLFTYEGNGKLVINNGTFYGGWRFSTGEPSTDIYGGTFTVSYDGQSFQTGNTHKLTVYGGTFIKSDKLEADHSLTVKIDGCVADGYTVKTNEDGSKTIVKEAEENGSLFDRLVKSSPLRRAAIQGHKHMICAFGPPEAEFWISGMCAKEEKDMRITQRAEFIGGGDNQMFS